MEQRIIKTTCPYCGVGCGINATIDNRDAHQITIKGDEQHPANLGRLCSKGSALADTVSLQGRLLHPEINGQQTAWPEALDFVAEQFNDIIDKHGANAVAFYVSGQLLTEDYYVANKLMKGFIGSSNIDTNSRLCMSSAVMGYKRAFGADAVPGNYEDLELAELLVITGSNMAWCHPVLFQRVRKAKEQNPALKIVVIDPRVTDSCDVADLHLALKPGADVALFNGLLNFLSEQNRLDQHYIEQYCSGFAETVASAQSESTELNQIAQRCGLNENDLTLFYQWFAENDKTVTLYSQGVNQSTSGSDKCNAIINCHLATGRVGKPGASPFSLTGQPNAMGGREVGGMASTLAAHMDFNKPEDHQRIARFWKTENLASQPGLNAVDLFSAVDKGDIKAIWIMATNPVVSLPNADYFKQALERCPLVVVSDCIADTDTVQLANVKLPAVGWSEKNGTVTNSERRISRQRPLFPASGEAKPDWWIVCEIAKRMGFEQAFNFSSAADIFREHAALSAFENDLEHGLRDFNLTGLAELSDAEYDQLAPTQWPVLAEPTPTSSRLFADHRFFTPDRKARFIPVQWRPPANSTNNAYPLILNTGRIRDQWHTMTRTALSPRLNMHLPEPFIEIHPQDAESYAIIDESLAEVESAWGSFLGRVKITDKQQPGSLFIPMHWTAQLSSRGRVGALVNPVTDPYSGQPESKHTPVRIQTFQAAHYLFIISRKPMTLPDFDYQAVIKADQCFIYQLAIRAPQDNILQWGQQLLQSTDEQQRIEYNDPAKGVYRMATLDGNRLNNCILIADHWRLPDVNWLQTLFSQPEIEPQQRISLLSAKPPIGQGDVGRIVCSCYTVGETTIKNAIAKQKLTSVAEISQCLSAGSGCGSCIPELNEILNATCLSK